MTTATLSVYSKQSWLWGLAAKTILIKNTPDCMGNLTALYMGVSLLEITTICLQLLQNLLGLPQPPSIRI